MTLPTPSPIYYPGPYRLEYTTDGCDEVLEIYAHNADRPITDLRFSSNGDGRIPPRVLATAQLFAAAPQLVAMIHKLVAAVSTIPQSSVNSTLELGCTQALESVQAIDGKQ